MAEPRSNLIIIGGPPGAGKSTTSKALVELYDGPVIYIEGDVFWRFHVKPGSGMEFGKEALVAARRAMLSAACSYARHGATTTIVDFTINYNWLSTVLPKFRVEGVNVHYAVLRPSKDDCATRALSREEGKIEDYEPFSKLYDAFADTPEKHLLSLANRDAVELALHIKDAVTTGTLLI